MTILASDIKLVASKVMTDDPEGGGGPTSTIIQDGVSNQIFPDISEVDRAGGVVNLRQVFVSVQTDDTDTLLGANIIVAKPPEDPNVSITLFTTGNTFDERTDAESRLEAYLAAGVIYDGYLFGNHIAGQRTVAILQQTTSTPPVTDQTLLLSLNEAGGNPTQQYIRITTVASQTRIFYDANGNAYTRVIVSLGITDPLLNDFSGYDASVAGPSNSAQGSSTMIRDTVVADAAEYYGTVPVTSAVAVGDFSVQGDSIYTHLVPAAQQETPLADVRMNQQSSVVVAASDGTTSRTFGTITWTTAQALYIGSPVTPGSLSVMPQGYATVTDNGGKLMQSGVQVGTVDYSNGILALSTNVFGASVSVTADWTAGSTQTIVSATTGFPVTIEGQRTTYVATMAQIPVAGSMSVSFRAQGRWYTLQDDGSGALRGADSSYGVGTINFTTGTLSLTLGALPDVGSQVLIAYAPDAQATPASSTPTNNDDLETLDHFRKVITLGRAITPGTLTLTWNDGVARTATDSNGYLIGDATGTVTYASGNIQFAPNVLPAVGTSISVALTDTTKTDLDIAAFTGGGSTWTGTLGSAVNPRSVIMSVGCSFPVRQYPGTDSTVESLMRIFDNGDGKLYVSNVTNNLAVGTINYSTGAFTLNVHTTNFQSVQSTWSTIAGVTDPAAVALAAGTVLTGSDTRSLTLTILSAPTTPIAAPTWAWWTGSQSGAAKAEFTGGTGTAYSGTVAFDLIQLPEVISYGLAATGSTASISYMTSFNLGTNYYSVRNNNTTSSEVDLNPSPATGEGTIVGATGTLTSSTGASVQSVNLTMWPTGITSKATNISQGQVATIAGAGTTSLTDNAVFRTAVSPLKSGSFSVVGTLADGTAVNATAASNGTINSGTAPVGTTPGSWGVFGSVDYTYGVVTVHFGRRVPAASAGTAGVVDLTYLGITGVTYVESASIQADTLRYNASAYTYLPLDADLIGVNPVRLPSDGRVPIFRAGSYAVIGEDFTTAQTVANGTVVDTGHVRLSRVTITGANGTDVETGFTADLEAGTVTFTDITGYSQPITIDARIEDMMLVSVADISGLLTFTRAVTHTYSTDAFISSALVPGNLKARVSLTFDQSSWDGVTFSDVVSGAAATGTYDDTNHPIAVTNVGASTERFALQFTSSTAFRVVSEHLGVIANGTVNSDCAPLNAATSEPYFTIAAAGWGSGWVAGNILRINTVGALYPVWVIRTVQQGPETELDDSTTILIRGDVDRP